MPDGCPPIIDWEKEQFVYKDKTITLKDIKNHINEYAIATNAPQGSVASWEWHSKRYLMSLKYVAENQLFAGTVYEAGGAGIFTYLLEKIFTFDTPIVHTTTDLRHPLELSPASIDSILCMEVFEHINDVHLHHQFRFDGVRRMLESFWNILKPNGCVFVTTPNISGALSIYKIIKAKNPMMFPMHVREYTPQELKCIFEAVGYEVFICCTEYIFPGYSIDYIHSFLKSAGAPTDNRGDDVVVIARKPENATMSANANLYSVVKSV